MNPELKHRYTRAEISQMCGGSSVPYLPTRNGEVVCGCFEPEDLNPGAPEEVLFGAEEYHPVVEKTAELVYHQGVRGIAIPIFLKRAPKEWEYVGEYRCVELSRDPALLEQKRKAHPERGQIKGILRLVKVGTTFLFVTKSDESAETVESGKSRWWSCSSTTRNGDHALVYVAKVGIQYEWRVISNAKPDKKWTYTCDVIYVRTFDPPITIRELREAVTREEWAPPHLNFRGNQSLTIPAAVATRIRALRPTNEILVFPDEAAASVRLPEGAVREVLVNAYERNHEARRKCIEYHGTACGVCGMEFVAAYGPLSEGFIHVHHLKPLSEIAKEYTIDPVADLRPVCPNCHAIIHIGGECRSPDEARSLVDPRVLAFWSSFTE